MANNFLDDPTCVSVYRLETLLTMGDDLKGNNDLTNVGVTADAVNYKEGVGSCDLDAFDYLQRLNAVLSSDFPFKNGTSNTDISVALWFWIDFVPIGNHNALVSVYLDDAYTTYTGFAVEIGGSDSLTTCIGYGASLEAHSVTYLFLTGTWYHLVATWRDSTKTATYRIWDGATATSKSQTFVNNVLIGTGPFRIGRWDYSAGSNYWFDGRMDEIVIFNRVLTDPEADKIRKGIYTTAFRRRCVIA